MQSGPPGPQIKVQSIAHHALSAFGYFGNGLTVLIDLPFVYIIQGLIPHNMYPVHAKNQQCKIGCWRQHACTAN